METKQDQFLMRLQVFLAHCGIASRRACEALILDGRVQVNGQPVVELGTKVSKNDVVCFDGKPVSLEEKKVYVLLNKPKGYLCASHDDFGRPLAKDLLAKAYQQRLYNVGRLDLYSSGAIIFTNDGDFSAKVEHPSSEIEKEYEVITVFEYPDEILQKFLRGVRIEGVFYKALSAERISKNKMRIVLIEGKNREIRRVLKFFNIKIKKLIRVRIGCVYLSDLPSGKHRPLTSEEIKGLLG